MKAGDYGKELKRVPTRGFWEERLPKVLLRKDVLMSPGCSEREGHLTNPFTSDI